MTKLFVEDVELPLAAFLYHYRSNPKYSKTYKIIVSMDETDVIKQIESYAGCPINDELLVKRILKKDKESRSMGLIWWLQTIFEKRKYSDLKSIESIDWTINNIRQILVGNDRIEIIGDINNN